MATQRNGTQIATGQDAVIPEANPPNLGQSTVSAHAMHTGTRGNIPAYDIDTPCYLTAVKAVNRQAFYGGQDERNYQTVTREDINLTASHLKDTLHQSMQGALQGQLRNGEALVTPTCILMVSSDHQIGAEVTQVKVTVSDTCSAVAYNENTLRSIALRLLTVKAFKQLGVGYSLLGTIQIIVSHASATHTSPTLVLSLQGIWVYALSVREQERMKSRIQGHAKQEALHILLSLPDIERASIAWGDTTKLPKDTRNIHIVVMYTV